MSVSTDGQICFGIPFEEGYRFPWDKEDKEYEGDIEEWWRIEICKYKPPFEIYDGNEYIDGREPTKEKISEYYAAQRAFDEAHPVPVELVNYCSDDCEMYIVSIPDSVTSCRRGYPEEFSPRKLKVSKDQRQVLIDFCKKYCKPEVDEDGEFPEMKPKWYLSSYWG